VNSEKDAGSRLPHLDPEKLDIFRQSWKRILHSILSEHLSDVEVGSDAECTVIVRFPSPVDWLLM
jgi:hypothetical protein